jgi:hypothetical protein
MWTSSTDTTAAASTATLPTGFCSAGYTSLNAAFIISLLVDLVFQVRFLLGSMTRLALAPLFISFLASIQFGIATHAAWPAD